MFTVYAIYNTDKEKIYIGHTAEIERRLKRHKGKLPNAKKSFTAKNKGQWLLVYGEEFKTRRETIKRERELKSAKGRESIKTFINKKIKRP